MRHIATTLAALLLVASPAIAQKVDGKGIPYRAWDVDAGVGFHSMTGVDGDVGDEAYDNDWEPSWIGSVNAGYYWNNHLKTEAGVTFDPSWVTNSPAAPSSYSLPRPASSSRHVL